MNDFEVGDLVRYVPQYKNYRHKLEFGVVSGIHNNAVVFVKWPTLTIVLAAATSNLEKIPCWWKD